MGAEAKAWLELPSGDSVQIEGSCSIGRASSNNVVLPDDRVSRHHAVIRTAETDECWVVDLGSANGTYVNHRRVNAVRLRDGDVLTIGASLVTFHSAGGDDLERANLGETLHEVQQFPAWLFLADIENSTAIVRRLGPQAMASAFADWMDRCKSLLDATGGIIDKPLGDGWLAFWRATELTAGDVARGLTEFRRYQSDAQLPFRMVLHLGTTFTGGQVASGMYRLFGPDVNFTFRMEALAKKLAASCLVSQAARDALGSHVSAEPAGSHPVPGLEGSYSFFRL